MNNTYLNNLNNESVRELSNQRIRKKLKWIGIGVLLIVIIFTVFLTTKTVTAKREIDRVKQVTSIQIQKGDTLWSIASRYISDEYKDMNEYIEEIMHSNGLVSEDINAGKYIIIPYYADVRR
ncbi:MAG: LysM peptidoglycan-binding domain-containing protein [Clostridiales bacterium]|nr:LysM peptidoglycan-binding domain-containing protein [Clostridiales bacterium]